MPSFCSNCSKVVGDRDSALQCDGCKRSLHMECTGLSSTDRVTRQKVRGLSILCNACTSNLSTFADFKKIINELKSDIQEKIGDLKTDMLKTIDNYNTLLSAEIASLNNKLSNVESLNSIEITDKIANEAVERISRAKNVFIRGVPEPAGDTQNKKDSDRRIIEEVLNAVTCSAEPVSLYRVGKPNQRFPRMLKVVMPTESDAKYILKNKKRLLEHTSTRTFTIIDDKTPIQQQYLKQLRAELDTRLKNGERDLTIKYVHGSPKIVSFRQ